MIEILYKMVVTIEDAGKGCAIPVANKIELWSGFQFENTHIVLETVSKPLCLPAYGPVPRNLHILIRHSAFAD